MSRYRCSEGVQHLGNVTPESLKEHPWRPRARSPIRRTHVNPADLNKILFTDSGYSGLQRLRVS